MKTTNRVLSLIGLLLITMTVGRAQISNEAWKNFNISAFEEVTIGSRSDATIIFDRTYTHTRKGGEGQTVQAITVHRKIKINSLYGLEKLNKLYIPTFDDLHYKVNFVNCKAKTLKPDNTVVKTDTSRFVSTTLPANAPFFYKVQGSVKMLPLNGVNIGDEIEYVYKIERIYDRSPRYFYQADRTSFSGNNFCIERSLYFDSRDFKTEFWPHNFEEKSPLAAKFDYRGGKKITLKNIGKRTDHLYHISHLHEPYLLYLISPKEDEEDVEKTWENITQFSSIRNKEMKRHAFFENEEEQNIQEQLSEVKGMDDKFELLLKRLNEPIESNVQLYDRVEGDMDIAWGYVQTISLLMEKLQIPVQFHFAVNKKNGTFDSENVSIHQFDKVFLSFKNEKGKRHYLPLLEPYSQLDEINRNYQGNLCFTIDQTAIGRRSHLFSKLPDFQAENKVIKSIQLKLVDSKKDSMFFDVSEEWTFTADAFTGIKPYVKRLTSDSSNTDRYFKRLIRRQLPSLSTTDTISLKGYEVDQNQFSLKYTYRLKCELVNQSGIIALSPALCIEHNFYTPFSLRNKRAYPGYLYGETDLEYHLSIDMGGQFSWIENTSLNNEEQNAIGMAKTIFIPESQGVKLLYLFDLKKESFGVSEWPDMLKLRDASYKFLEGNLYFERNN